MTRTLLHRKITPETAVSPEKPALDAQTASALSRYQRAANYLSAAQIYLKSNALLEEPLKPGHIKDRLLGHWGTAPGINLIYSHLNRIILDRAADILLVTGPGHGAAANLANMYIEGTLVEFFPEMTRNRAGLEKFVKAFSWPEGFPSHLSPGLPGVINEGGELGYALPAAFGAAFDNPDLVVACIVGDGEAETGPTAAAWHGSKFINPATDGAVLPIVHINGFKISSPSIFGTMTNGELESLFSGYGYTPLTVEHGPDLNNDMANAMDKAFDIIGEIQISARSGNFAERPRWPVILMRTLKGMTGPAEVDGNPVEGSFRSHQVPAKDLKENPEHLRIVEKWLRSYRPQELFGRDGRPAEDILKLCPAGNRRMAMNPHAIGANTRKELELPDMTMHSLETKKPGELFTSGMEKLGGYLRDLVRLNSKKRNFRIFCPDELESNRLGAVLETTARQYQWPAPRNSEHLSREGRVMEMLSEHNCQGWLQGYLLTGRHGIFPCYEAFISIVDGMMNQYAKFLKTSAETPWRKPVSSLNYLLTSEAWRQDHNGYSHQGPGFINSLLTKKGHTYRIYFPPDGNCLISTMAHCLKTTNYVNLVIAGKQPSWQWLNMQDAIEHCRVGASIWRWASANGGEAPDIILAGCGDNMTLEVMAAVRILREEAPDWRVRVVNVVRLLALGIPQKYPSGMEEDEFRRIFPPDCPVVFNFHGYTAAVKQLLWERPGRERFEINGYREEGTTTTPFDMQVLNRTSRYHLVIQTAQKMSAKNPAVAATAEELIRKYERKLAEHREFIVLNGKDPDEITDWKWNS